MPVDGKAAAVLVLSAQLWVAPAECHQPAVSSTNQSTFLVRHRLMLIFACFRHRTICGPTYCHNHGIAPWTGSMGGTSAFCNLLNESGRAVMRERVSLRDGPWDVAPIEPTLSHDLQCARGRGC